MLRRAHVSVEDKLRLVRLVRAYRALDGYQLLADQLGINRSTARSIVSPAMQQLDPEAIEDAARIVEDTRTPADKTKKKGKE